MPSIQSIRSRADPALRDRFRACLLAGAAGDALGAAMKLASTLPAHARFGPEAVRSHIQSCGPPGRIGADTQMTLFTAEGLMRAWVRWCSRGIACTTSVVSHAYQRWLRTQGIVHPRFEGDFDGWLIGVRELHCERAPGRTCISALRSMESFGSPARNRSKGCGGLMRVAPVGLFEASAAQPGASGSSGPSAIDLGCETAALTHGHRTGILAAGLFADIISRLLQGASLPGAIERGRTVLRQRPGHEEVETSVRRACELAAQPADPTAIPEALGAGWVAEEALAISLYVALVAPDLASGVMLAASHGSSGEGNSTATLVGQLLGAIHGLDAIPPHWLSDLELRGVIEEVADDLASMWFWKLDEYEDRDGSVIRDRYPGW